MHLSIEVAFAFFLFALVVLLVLKRQVEMTNKKNNTNIDIESTKYIGNKHRIVIVKAGDKRVLIGVTPSTISRLCELSSTVYEVRADERVQDESNNRLRDAV